MLDEHAEDQAPRELLDELRNFREIAKLLNPSPGEVPDLAGIDVFGISMPFREVIGGDHLIYVDFKKRYDLEARIARAEARERHEVAEHLRSLSDRAGILIADVSGHRMTDAVITAMLHQAFLLGVNYELQLYGEITRRIFEHLNTRLHRTTATHKFVAMLYGEITERGRFRFLAAGHHPPAVFSREYRRFVEIGDDRLVAFPPVGLLPSSTDPEDRRQPSLTGYKKRYEVNEINLLNAGDLLLLYTDGLSEHADGTYFETSLEPLLAEIVDLPAKEICERIRDDVRARAEPEDDITFVVIKRDR